MNFGLLWKKALNRIKKDGLIRFVQVVLNRCMPQSKDKDTDFDVKNGTDTENSVQLWRISTPFSSVAEFGAEYRTPPEWRITDALQRIPRYATFVDLGCGKGRPLIVASRLGFKKVVGVEFMPTLANIARKNIEITGVKCNVVVADAGEWELPSGPLCVYLYSPFGVQIMRKVAEKLKSLTDEVWVVYLNPQPDGCIGLFAFLREFRNDRNLRVWTSKTL